MLRLIFFISAATSLVALAQNTILPATSLSAIDAEGNIYVVGSTSVPNVPVTPGAFQTGFTPGQCGSAPGPNGLTPLPCFHSFIAKIDPSGQHIIYATYLGGRLQDGVEAIAVGASGNVYVTGSADSPDFPVTAGAWQTSLGNGTSAGFITELNPQGSGLVFSTYIPGGYGSAIALDPAGNVFVAGTAGAAFVTTPGAFQTTGFPGGAFVLKLNSIGSGLIYSTLLGGSLTDTANALAIDAAGNAYVAGSTDSTPANENAANGPFTLFPVTPGAVNLPGKGSDVFVAELNASGTALLYSAVFGSSGSDGVQALTVNAAGEVYAVGYAVSSFGNPNGDTNDFPTTPDAWRPSGGNGFAVALNAGGTEFIYSTYLSDPGKILVDQAGNALIAGTTSMSDLPVMPDAFLPCFPTSGPTDIRSAPYILQLNASGTGLLYATYLPNAVIGVSGPLTVYLASNSAIFDRIDLSAPAPPGISCVVNAASYRGPAIAPGEIVSIFGPAIGPEQPAGAVLDASGRVSTSLGNTRVLVGGVPAPLLYVSRNQINAIVPFEIAGQTQTTMQIETNGADSLPAFQSPVSVAAPGIFTLDGSGSGQAAALNQDGTLNSSDNPAEQGSIVTIFATGLGAMTPAPVDGSIPTGPFARPGATVDVPIGGAFGFADLQYVGDAPEEVEGVVQINLKLPALPQGGPHIILVDADTVTSPVSPLTVTIFVH